LEEGKSRCSGKDEMGFCLPFTSCRGILATNERTTFKIPIPAIKREKK
jgi:hypothetical protein